MDTSFRRELDSLIRSNESLIYEELAIDRADLLLSLDRYYVSVRQIFDILIKVQ